MLHQKEDRVRKAYSFLFFAECFAMRTPQNGAGAIYAEFCEKEKEREMGAEAQNGVRIPDRRTQSVLFPLFLPSASRCEPRKMAQAPFMPNFARRRRREKREQRRKMGFESPHVSPNTANPNCFVTTELFGFVFYFDYPY